jgi:ABC-type transport system involved in cytochrome bd biosynthesis fused ATPase/permease subunit
MWKLFTAVNRMVADGLITEEQAAQMWLDSKEILQDTLRDTTIEKLKGATDMTTTGTLKEFDTVYVTSIKKIKENAEKKERETLTRDAILGLKKQKTPDTVIATAFNIPLEQVQAVRA